MTEEAFFCYFFFSRFTRTKKRVVCLMPVFEGVTTTTKISIFNLNNNNEKNSSPPRTKGRGPAAPPSEEASSAARRATPGVVQ